jgi:hypothetical protein
MAMSKKEFEPMASLFSSNAADFIDSTGTVRNIDGLAAVTRLAIGFMNLAYESNKRFDGDKFIEWCGLGRFIQWHEGFSHKEARWTPFMQRLVIPDLEEA